MPRQLLCECTNYIVCFESTSRCSVSFYYSCIYAHSWCSYIKRNYQEYWNRLLKRFHSHNAFSDWYSFKNKLVSLGYNICILIILRNVSLVYCFNYNKHCNKFTTLAPILQIKVRYTKIWLWFHKTHNKISSYSINYYVLNRRDFVLSF